MKIKRNILWLLVCGCMFLGACGVAVQTVPTDTGVQQTDQTSSELPVVVETPEPTPIKTTEPELTQTVLGVIHVEESDTLERDIIPQLCEIFSLGEQDVKQTLAEPIRSSIINEKLTDYRQLEGIILPGEYSVEEGDTLKSYVNIWIKQAEQRYETLKLECNETNDLTGYEQLALASVVEWECLANEYRSEVATVFLNRLDKGSKLQSCVTSEYALSYQRPFLTGEDIKIQSEYNTYVSKGVPIGPICVIDDESLVAAISKKTKNNEDFFFFYDYALDEMFFFSDYQEFKRACTESRQRFSDTFDMDFHEKVNKQEMFGYGPIE